MNNYMTGIFNLFTSYTPLIYMLLAVSLMIEGVLFIIPSEKTKQFAQSTIPWVLLGAGIVLCATQIANEITATFAF